VDEAESHIRLHMDGQHFQLEELFAEKQEKLADIRGRVDQARGRAMAAERAIRWWFVAAAVLMGLAVVLRRVVKL
jgi:hypothetical protein